jgi:hypothetical protein
VGVSSIILHFFPAAPSAVFADDMDFHQKKNSLQPKTCNLKPNT